MTAAAGTSRLGPLGRLGLQAWVILFIGATGTMVASVAQVRPVVHLLWVLPVLLWAMRTRPALPSTLTWAITAVLAAYGIASLASRSPWMSLETAGIAAAAAALFVVAAGMSRSTRSYVARAVLIALGLWLAAVVVAWSADAVAWVADAGWPPPAEPIRAYVWLTSNSIPVIVLLSVPLIGWLGGEVPDRWLARIYMGVAIPAVLLSGGAIGIFSVVAAVVVYLVLDRITSRLHLLVAVGGAAAIVALAGLFLAIGPEVSLPSTAEARLRLWEQGAGMLGSDLLTGTGPGTSALVRREYVPPHGAPVLTDHLHSVPIQAAAEGGLLLISALSVAVVAWASRLWSTRARHADGGKLAIACLAGAFVSFLGDSFFDIPVVVALLVTGAAWNVSHEDAPRSRLGPGALRLAIAGLAVLSVIPVVSADVARLMAVSGRSEALAGDWSAALERFESAARWNPANPLYRLESGEAARNMGRTDLARTYFGQSTAMAPGDGRTWGALASVTTDPELEIRLLTAATERADGDAQFAHRLGAALEEAGRPDDAARAYAEAVALQPDLMAALPAADGTGVSRADIIRALPATLDAIAEVARLERTAIEWDLQLLAGTLDADAPAAWQAVAAMRDGDAAAAVAYVDEARDRSPTDPRTWQAAVFVHLSQCSAAEAEHAQRLERMLAGSHRFQRDERLRDWERVYREAGIGDYQPDELAPRDEQWPVPLVDLEACP